MYARRVGGRDLTFDFAAGLVNDNLLIVDRQTSSVWSQLDQQAIAGPLQGTALVIVPSVQTTWRAWRLLHPETRVLTAGGKAGRPYLYRNVPAGRRGPRSRPKGHDTSALGLGVRIGNEARFFALSELARAATPIEVTMGGAEIRVHYDGPGMTAWALDSEGVLLPGILSYRSGWMGFNPDASVFRAPAVP